MTMWFSDFNISGTSLEHLSLASGQRVWKRHPEGRLRGEGISPLRMICFACWSLSSGNVNIDAEINALVYGCKGSSNTASVSPYSTISPRYMIATLWLINRTVARLCAITR